MSDTAEPQQRAPKSRQRWWIHLLLLSAYPILLGIVPGMIADGAGETLLPKRTRDLIVVMVFELLLFALIFGAAWFASRATPGQLLLSWTDGLKHIRRGFLYSIALRLAVSVVLVVVVIAAAAFVPDTKELVERFRPRTEVVIDREALTGNPIYLILVLTLVSFVVGGLREELWRSGMFAGMQALFPDRWSKTSGQLAGVTIAAVIFGIGHFPQGWGGAAVTALLGYGLGAIMVYYRSIWEAVFAHGFFNATSFIMLYYVARSQSHLLPSP